MLFTLLFAAYLHGLVDRSTGLARAVDDRTFELSSQAKRLEVEIDERVKAEKAMRESEQRFRTLVQNSSDILTILEDDGTVRYESPALTRVLGYETEEVVGKSAFEFIHPDDVAPTMQGFEQCLAQPGVNVAAEFRWLHKDGSWVYLEAIGNNQLDNPLVGGVMVNSRDATERRQAEKRIEQERAAHQEHLSTLASEISLAEERERRRIAVNIHDRIGQSLSLAQIRMEAIRHDMTGEAAETLNECVTLVGRSIQDSRSLMFELSPPVLYDFGFEAAVEWLIDQYRNKGDVILTLEKDDHDKPLSEAMRVTLFRAMRELLINITKHAKAGNGHITLSRDENLIHITIQDDGVGFEYRPDASHGNGDAGFGLFSIREQLSRMGGEIHIDSTPGSGTRVILIAPLDLTD